MKQFYIYQDNEQIGPLDIEELKAKKISRETKVWFEGLEEWKNAGEIDELKSILSSIPPPINTFASKPPIPKVEEKIEYSNAYTLEEEPRILGMSRKIFLLACGGLTIIVSIFLYSSSHKSNIVRENQINEAQVQIEQQQKEIDEQNQRIAEQERIEQERIEREKRIAIEKRISEITEELNIAYQKLSISKQQLNDATGFKFLRSSSERNRDINTASDAVASWEQEIKRLENEMREINPNWD